MVRDATEKENYLLTKLQLLKEVKRLTEIVIEDLKREINIEINKEEK